MSINGKANYGNLLSTYPEYADEIHTAVLSKSTDREEETDEIEPIDGGKILSGFGAAAQRLASLNKESGGQLNQVVSTFNSLQGRIAAVLREPLPYSVLEALADVQAAAAQVAQGGVQPESALSSLEAASGAVRKIMKGKINGNRKQVAAEVRGIAERLRDSMQTGYQTSTENDFSTNSH